MCGIGGGLFAVPLLYIGYRLPLRRAVATSLGLVFANATAATLSEALRADSAIDARLAACMIVGALLGARLGYLLGRKLDTRLLRMIFIAVLILSGLRVWLGDALPAPAADIEQGPWTQGLLSVLIGFAGGVLAPLLGIGGGLIFVPALFIALPGLGFAGARACSMAASVAASMRSLFLYIGEGGIIVWPYLGWLATGAVLGGGGGVWAVHQPGVIEFARFLLVILMYYVALRLGFELRAEKRADRDQSEASNSVVEDPQAK